MSVVASIEIRPEYRISTIIADVRRHHGIAGVADMMAAFDGGVTTFDIGEFGSGAELIMGAFLEDLWLGRSTRIPHEVGVHAQLSLNSPAVIEFGRDQVEAIVDRSLMRLGLEKLDLVQLRWPGSDHPGCLDALAYLSLMQARGKVGHIGLANFDYHHLRMFMDAGVDIAAIKVPYSLVDRRPQGAMTAFCHQNDIAVIASDVLVGGFLSDAWLGATDPEKRIGDSETLASRQIIETFGGWSLFQELLMTLQSIATRHGTTIEDIALRAIHDHADPASMTLDSSRIGAFISRLETKNFAPTERDREVLSAVLLKRRASARPISGIDRKAVNPKADVSPSKLRMRLG